MPRKPHTVDQLSAMVRAKQGHGVQYGELAKHVSPRDRQKRFQRLLADSATDDQIIALVNKTWEMAIAGDQFCMGLIYDRIMGKNVTADETPSDTNVMQNIALAVNVLLKAGLEDQIPAQVRYLADANIPLPPVDASMAKAVQAAIDAAPPLTQEKADGKA